MLAAVEQAVRATGGTPDGVGVGVPGFVREGVVLASPNFPTWREVDVGEELVRRLGRPVVVENDANAATLGAWAMRGACRDLVLLTLGTGVGGGVVAGGRLLRGAGSTGAELGHVFAGGSRRCGCGGVGCLETWSSTTGLVAAARERGKTVATGREVVALADDGVPWAIEVCEAAGAALGRAVVGFVNLFNPDDLVITGGLARAAHRFAPAVERALATAVAPSAEWVEVSWEPGAEDLAIRGAAQAAAEPR